jgi:hypothetical protein
VFELTKKGKKLLVELTKRLNKEAKEVA